MELHLLGLPMWIHCLENGEAVEYIEEFFFHLGDIPCCEGGAWEASCVRVTCAWKRFRQRIDINIDRPSTGLGDSVSETGCLR